MFPPPNVIKIVDTTNPAERRLTKEKVRKKDAAVHRAMTKSAIAIADWSEWPHMRQGHVVGASRRGSCHWHLHPPGREGGGGTIFSKIEVVRSDHHVLVQPQDVPKTVVNSHYFLRSREHPGRLLATWHSQLQHHIELFKILSSLSFPGVEFTYFYKNHEAYATAHQLQQKKALWRSMLNWRSMG